MRKALASVCRHHDNVRVEIDRLCLLITWSVRTLVTRDAAAVVMPAHDMADCASKLELENDGRKRFVNGEATYLAGPVWSTSSVPRNSLEPPSNLLGQPRRRRHQTDP